MPSSAVPPSTSRIMTNRYSPWLIGGLAALFVFSIPLIVSNATASHDPEIRAIRSGRHFAALIVTDSGRVLFVNSDDRRVTRSLVGRLARPWESDAATVIAPAQDRTAVGLYETMQHPAITQVIVLGLPGADPIWSAIERDSATRGIDVHFLATESRIETLPVTLDLGPSDDDHDAYIAVSHGSTLVGISGGDDPPSTPLHVAILAAWPDDEIDADLVIVPVRPETDVGTSSVVTRDNEVVRITLADGEVRVSGGRLYSATR